jgi:hypothetical protein
MNLADSLLAQLSVHLRPIAGPPPVFGLPPFYTFEFRITRPLTWQSVKKGKVRLHPVDPEAPHKVFALRPSEETPDDSPLLTLPESYIVPFVALQGHAHFLHALHTQPSLKDEDAVPVEEYTNTRSLLMEVVQDIRDASVKGPEAAARIKLLALEQWWILTIAGHDLTFRSVRDVLGIFIARPPPWLGNMNSVLDDLTLIKDQRPFRVQPGHRWSGNHSLRPTHALMSS